MTAKVQSYKEAPAWVWARQTRFGGLAKAGRNCAREFLRWARCGHVTLPSVAELEQAIGALAHPSSDAVSGKSDGEEPVFLLSTGWRAGSTLLQRILVTDPRLLVWGEPFGEMTLVSRLTEMVSHSLSPRDMKLWHKQGDPPVAKLMTSWIAT